MMKPLYLHVCLLNFLVTGVGLVCVCVHVHIIVLLFYRMGSHSPPNASQPPAFFSKLTESNSAIVKSKKQEIIKKMTVVGSETDFSKSDLRTGLTECSVVNNVILI